MRAPHHVGAAAPGPVTPSRSDNAPCQARVGEEGEADEGHFAASGSEHKAQATLIKRAHLVGVQLVRHGNDGAWTASRWGLAKDLADAAAVDAWLQRVAPEVRA